MAKTLSLANGTRFMIGHRPARLAGAVNVTFDDADTEDQVAEILAASDEELSNQTSQSRNLALNVAVLNRQEIAGADPKVYSGLVFPAGGATEFNAGDALDVTYGTRGEKIYTDRGQPPALDGDTDPVVEDAAPTIVVVTFAVDVNSAEDDYAAGFSVTVDDDPVVISEAARQVDNKVVHLTLAAPVANAEVVLLSYDIATGDLKSDNGAELQSFTDAAVTNNVAP